jgi:hypothetical protein
VPKSPFFPLLFQGIASDQQVRKPSLYPAELRDRRTRCETRVLENSIPEPPHHRQPPERGHFASRWPRPISMGAVNRHQGLPRHLMMPLLLAPGRPCFRNSNCGSWRSFPRRPVRDSAKHAVQRGVADAKPVFLADEMMTKVILLDPAAQPRSRLARNWQGISAT